MAEKKVAKDAAARRKKIVKHIDRGAAHIHSSFNNTIVTITDTKGNAISASSSGALGFKGSRKSTPYAAQMVAEKAGKAAKEHGIRSVDVYVKGAGQGRESAIRALQNCDIAVTLIQDVSGIAHNGCRPRKTRRI